MPIALTPQQIDLVWDQSASRRSVQQKRHEYYEGKQAILLEGDTRTDGSKRSKVVTNWIRKVVNDHTAFALTNAPGYTLSDPDPSQEDAESQAQLLVEKEALAQFETVRRDNNLDAIDQEHFKQAVKMGFSVEVHAFDSVTKKITITQYDPRCWAFLFDTNEKMLAAIHRAELAAGTYYNDRILEATLVVYTVYDDRNKTTFEESISPDQSGKPVRSLNVIGAFEQHYYGRPPVVLFKVSKDAGTFVSDALISLQDAYNTSHSNLLDDVQYNVDAVLAIKGYEPGAMFEKDEDGVRFIDKLRQYRMLPLNKEADAKFLEKGNPKDKIEYDISLTRDDIHMEGAIADVSRIVGATGSVSGIALKLKLKPMIGQAASFLKWFSAGLRDRVELLNIVWAKLNTPSLTEYLITFNIDVPVNETEIWQFLPNLDGLLSRVDRIRLIPSIKDPEQAAQRKKAEEEDLLDPARFPSDIAPDPDNPDGSASDSSQQQADQQRQSAA